jgi:hypothetical protein
MKWKLIFLLSLFGLAMGFATVFFIHTRIEPLFWLGIFIICAYLIAKYCTGQYFLHGFLVSIVNSFWITAVHIIFFHQYMGFHPMMAQKMSEMPLAYHPLRQMAVTGPLIGILSGLVLGLFAFLASRILKKNQTPANL